MDKYLVERSFKRNDVAVLVVFTVWIGRPAIGGTTTLFVFAFGIVLSVLWPRLARETLSLCELLQKAAAALCVAVGVALVAR